MKKNLLIVAATIIFVTATIGSINTDVNKEVKLNDLLTKNIESLTQAENPAHKYKVREERTVTVLDDATGEYVTIKTIYCRGTGTLDC